MLVWNTAAEQTARPPTPIDVATLAAGYRVDSGQFYVARNINGSIVWNLESGNVSVPPVADPALEFPSNIIMSPLPAVTAAALASGTGYFVYMGLTKRPLTANFVEFHVTAGGTGAQTAEVALCSSPAAPTKAGQSLTKLVATGTVDALTGTGVMRNTADFATAIAAGVHLWAGIRTAMATTQPTIFGITADMSQGYVLSAAAVGVLTAAGPFAGALIAASVTAFQAPNLRFVCT